MNNIKTYKQTLKKASAILLLLLLISTTSCKKDKIKTPEDYRVTYGNQTFGAYLNGQPWVADYRDAGNGVGPLDIQMQSVGNPGSSIINMWLIARKNNEQINIYLPGPLQPGRILLNKNTQPYPYELNPQPYGMYELYSPQKRFITNTDVTGFVDILRYENYGKIEAKFEFTAKSQTSNETITITNGYKKKPLKN
jgi:hypothetical protein